MASTSKQSRFKPQDLFHHDRLLLGGGASALLGASRGVTRRIKLDGGPKAQRRFIDRHLALSVAL